MMRNLALISGLLFVSTLPARGKPLNQKDLDALSKAVAEVAGLEALQVKGEFTAAEEDENGLVTSLTFQAEGAEKDGKKTEGTLHIELGKPVHVGLKINYYGDELPEDYLTGLFSAGKKVHKAVDKVGVYQLDTHLHTKDFTRGSLSAYVTPKPGGDAESINFAKAELVADEESDHISLNVQASFNADGKLVKESQEAVSKVIASVRQGGGLDPNVLAEAAMSFVEIYKQVARNLEDVL